MTTPPPATALALALTLALALAACGAPPSTTANSMTSAGSTEPAADNIAAPPSPSPSRSVPVVAAPVPAPTAAPTPAATAATMAGRDYAGRWIGVEGTYLNVTPTGPATVSMEMQYDLDHHGTYSAAITRAGLRFTRGGETLIARPSDGNATGLKWLAGKANCLTVRPGEGYCRA